MTPADLDALEARLATIDDEVWTVLGGNANATMGHIKALRAAAPHLIAQARALESLRPLIRETRAAIADAGDLGDFHPACKDALTNLAYHTLALFPEET